MGLKAKPKSYSAQQIQEFETSTLMLSLQGAGAWIKLRMYLQTIQTHCLEISVERLAGLLRCQSDTLLTVLKEFELAIGCGFTVQWPPGYEKITDTLRLIYDPDEKAALFSSSESLRVQKAVEDKKKKEKIPMPENWSLSEKMRDFGLKCGMTTATVTHEFDKCRTRHMESVFTPLGWESLTWRTWCLNWVSYGRIQVLPNSNGSGTRPPPFPPKTHVIERGLWRKAYGDPKDYGYQE